MIKITDVKNQLHYVAPTEVVHVYQSTAATQYGVKSYVILSNGERIESSQEATAIVDLVEKAFKL
jgi:hypothetical protein